MHASLPKKKKKKKQKEDITEPIAATSFLRFLLSPFRQEKKSGPQMFYNFFTIALMLQGVSGRKKKRGHDLYVSDKQLFIIYHVRVE